MLITYLKKPSAMDLYLVDLNIEDGVTSLFCRPVEVIFPLPMPRDIGYILPSSNLTRPLCTPNTIVRRGEAGSSVG